MITAVTFTQKDQRFDGREIIKVVMSGDRCVHPPFPDPCPAPLSRAPGVDIAVAATGVCVLEVVTIGAVITGCKVPTTGAGRGAAPWDAGFTAGLSVAALAASASVAGLTTLLN